MALKSGLAAQIGFSEETTPGTRVAPAFFLPLISESLADVQDPLESGATIAGRLVMTTEQRNGGLHKVGGDVQFEVYDNGWGLLLKHMFGAVAESGTGPPYTHTATPAAIDGKALTVQIGRPDVGGTVRPFDYLGCKVAEWELAGKAGEILTLGLTLAGMSSETTDSLATAAYPDVLPVKFHHAAVTLASVSVPVSAFSVKCARNVADSRYFAGSANAKEPLQQGLIEFTGELDVEFADLTQYAAYTAHTDLALEIVSTVGSNTFTLTGNIRLDDNTPNVSGTDILTQKLAFKALASDATDASAMQAVLTDTTAPPA